MAVVTEYKRNHYSGADADKANVAGAAGDTYYATNTGIYYKWDGTRWRGGYEYVPRTHTAVDFNETGTKAVFNTDGFWKVDGLDLSVIVPAGVVAVVLVVLVSDDAAGSEFYIRRNAAQAPAGIRSMVQVANLTMQEVAIIPVDADLLLDYFGTNLAFVSIQVTVAGWYI